MSEVISDSIPSRAGGRTWADLAFYLGAAVLGGGALALVGWAVYSAFGYVPVWVPFAALSSLIFVPWMMERAKDDSKLFIVVDGPMRMTEYRIGKRVPIKIDGSGIRFSSSSGVGRTILRGFDVETLEGRASMLEGCSQFDQIRDLSTLERVSKALEDSLREERLTMMNVGVEVEKKNRAIVDWALRILYEGTVPTEISEALGIMEDKGSEDVEVHDTLEAVLDGD